MAQEIKLEAAGLFTNPSDLARPEGALTVADNVVIRRPGVIEPRRGVTNYATLTSDNLFDYNGTLLSHNATTGVLSYDNGSGTFTANTGTYTLLATKAARAAQNIYFGTSASVYKKDTASATPYLAGTPKSYGLEALSSDVFLRTSNAGGITRSGTVATVVTTAAHGFYQGQVITQTSATEAPFVKQNYVVQTVVSSTSFTITVANSGAATSTTVHTFGPAQLELTNGWLADGFQAAYRVVFNRPDANNVEMPGAASSRFNIANTSAFRGYVATTKANVVLRIFVPADCTTTTTVRVYRSRAVEVAIEPSDELGLVVERRISSTELAQGWMDVTDITPDAMRGEALYVSPSQEGIEQNNERPPLCNDLVFDGTRMLFGNTRSYQRLEVSLLSVNKLVDGARISIRNNPPNGLIAKTSPTASNHFKIYTSGSDAQNIRNTAQEFCAAFNREMMAASVWWRAYYASSATDAPGRIMIERIDFGNAFSLMSDNASVRDAFFPRLSIYGDGSPVTQLSRTGSTVTATFASHPFLVGDSVLLADFSGPGTDFGAGPFTVTARTATTIQYTEVGAATTITPSGTPYYAEAVLSNKSDNDAAQNRVYESKPQEPEAVPLLNYFDVGERNKPILALAVMRSNVFAFKDDGLFIRTGPLSWELFDPTVRLIAPRSVVAVQNQIIALTTMGVVGVTDTGVEILSKPIEDKLLALQRLSYSKLKTLTFGVAYESEHSYELRTFTSANDTYATQCFRFNLMDRIWVRDTIPAKAGLVLSSDDKRYLAGATQILQERKTGGNVDYQDVGGSPKTADNGVYSDSAYFSTNPGFSVGNTVITNDGTTHVVAQANNLGVEWQIIFTTADVPLTATTFALCTPFTSTVQWAPVTSGDAGVLKLWRDANVLFQNGHALEMQADFTTELVTSAQSVTADLKALTGQWTATWDGTERPYNLSLLVPQETRRGTRLNVKLAFTKPNGAWRVNGLVLRLTGGGEKVSK